MASTAPQAGLAQIPLRRVLRGSALLAARPDEPENRLVLPPDQTPAGKQVRFPAQPDITGSIPRNTQYLG